MRDDRDGDEGDPKTSNVCHRQSEGTEGLHAMFTRNDKLQVEMVLLFAENFGNFGALRPGNTAMVKRSAFSTPAEGSRVCQPGSPGPVQGRGLRVGVAGAWPRTKAVS